MACPILVLTVLRWILSVIGVRMQSAGHTNRSTEWRMYLALSLISLRLAKSRMPRCRSTRARCTIGRDTPVAAGLLLLRLAGSPNRRSTPMLVASPVLPVETLVVQPAVRRVTGQTLGGGVLAVPHSPCVDRTCTSSKSSRSFEALSSLVNWSLSLSACGQASRNLPTDRSIESWTLAPDN